MLIDLAANRQSFDDFKRFGGQSFDDLLIDLPIVKRFQTINDFPEIQLISIDLPHFSERSTIWKCSKIVNRQTIEIGAPNADFVLNDFLFFAPIVKRF